MAESTLQILRSLVSEAQAQYRELRDILRQDVTASKKQQSCNTWAAKFYALYKKHEQPHVAILADSVEKERKLIIDFTNHLSWQNSQIKDDDGNTTLALLRFTLLYKHIITTPRLFDRGDGSSFSFIQRAVGVDWSYVAKEWLSAADWRNLIDKLLVLLDKGAYRITALRILTDILRRADLIEQPDTNKLTQKIFTKLDDDILQDKTATEIMQRFLGEPRCIASIVVVLQQGAQPELLNGAALTQQLFKLARARVINDDWSQVVANLGQASVYELANLITYLALGFLGEVASVNFVGLFTALNKLCQDIAKFKVVQTILVARAWHDVTMLQGLENLGAAITVDLVNFKQLLAEVGSRVTVKRIRPPDVDVLVETNVVTRLDEPNEPHQVSVAYVVDHGLSPVSVAAFQEVQRDASLSPSPLPKQFSTTASQHYEYVGELVARGVTERANQGAISNGTWRDLVLALRKLTSVSQLFAIIDKLTTINKDHSAFVWQQLGVNQLLLAKWFKHFTADDINALRLALRNWQVELLVTAVANQDLPAGEASKNACYQSLAWLASEQELAALLKAILGKGKKCHRFLLQVITEHAATPATLAKLLPKLSTKDLAKIVERYQIIKLTRLARNGLARKADGNNLCYQKLVTELGSITSLAHLVTLVAGVYKRDLEAASFIMALLEQAKHKKVAVTSKGLHEFLPHLTWAELRVLDLAFIWPRGGLLAWVLAEHELVTKGMPLTTQLAINPAAELTKVNEVAAVSWSSVAPAKLPNASNLPLSLREEAWVTAATIELAVNNWEKLAVIIFAAMYRQTMPDIVYRSGDFAKTLLTLLDTHAKRAQFLAALASHINSAECKTRYPNFKPHLNVPHTTTLLVNGIINKFVSQWLIELKDEASTLTVADAELLFHLANDEATLIPSSVRVQLRAAVLPCYLTAYPDCDAKIIATFDQENLLSYQKATQTILLNTAQAFTALGDRLWLENLATRRGDYLFQKVPVIEQNAMRDSLAQALVISVNMLTALAYVDDNALAALATFVTTVMDKIAGDRDHGLVDVDLKRRLGIICSTILANKPMVAKLDAKVRGELMTGEYYYGKAVWYGRRLRRGARNLQAMFINLNKYVSPKPSVGQINRVKMPKDSPWLWSKIVPPKSPAVANQIFTKVDSVTNTADQETSIVLRV